MRIRHFKEVIRSPEYQTYFDLYRRSGYSSTVISKALDYLWRDPAIDAWAFLRSLKGGF